MAIDPKKIVMDWVEKNFELESVEIEDYPMMLGGTLIRDKQGKEVIAFYEFVKNQVEVIFPKD